MPRRTATSVKMAFEEIKLCVAIANIQPLKLVSDAIKKTPKYAQIAASVREVGLVEPPVVGRDRSDPGKYLLLDGHLRIEILKDMGRSDVTCLVSTDLHLQQACESPRDGPGTQDDRKGGPARCPRRANCEGT
jgi:hypothetical protein